MKLRDKCYVLTDHKMLFNVTGDEHPKDRVFASLKYINASKWTQGYKAAVQYLASRHPDFVVQGSYISIPRNSILRCYDPFARWDQLTTVPAARGPLHHKAFTMADKLHTNIGLAEFGITDSLLWGNGHEQSDIDLVVRGRRNARLLLESGEEIYQLPGFSRPNPDVLKAPYGQSVSDWSRLLDRKLHMGSFEERLFSLRVVLEENELPPRREWESRQRQQELKFEIFDAVDSLAFPSVYRDQHGNELLDYSVVYEGVFRCGDVVYCQCEHLVSCDQGPPMHRYVIQKLIGFRSKFEQS